MSRLGRQARWQAIVLAALIGIVAQHAAAQGTPPEGTAPQGAMQGGHFPWKAGDTPPAIAGIMLGATRPTVERLLGAPAKVDTAGEAKAIALTLEYPAKGLAFVLDPDRAVSIIYLTTHDAGAIDEIRIGDDRARVLTRWGAPTAVRGGTAVYRAGEWLVAAELGDGQRIVRLGVGRVAEQSGK